MITMPLLPTNCQRALIKTLDFIERRHAFVDFVMRVTVVLGVLLAAVVMFSAAAGRR